MTLTVHGLPANYTPGTATMELDYLKITHHEMLNTTNLNFGAYHNSVLTHDQHRRRSDWNRSGGGALVIALALSVYVCHPCEKYGCL